MMKTEQLTPTEYCARKPINVKQRVRISYLYYIVDVLYRTPDIITITTIISSSLLVGARGLQLRSATAVLRLQTTALLRNTNTALYWLLDIQVVTHT